MISPRLTPHELRRLSVDACVCPQTTRNYLEGKPVRSTCAARIQEALDRRSQRDVGEATVAG